MNRTIEIVGLMALLVIMVIVVYDLADRKAAENEIAQALEKPDPYKDYLACLRDATKTYSECQTLLG